MRVVQQWFVTVALAAIGAIVVFIILSAQMSADTITTTPTPFATTDVNLITLVAPATPAPQPTVQPAATIAPQEREHIVVSGDTLGSIATAYGCTIDALVSHNQMANPDVLAVGDVINIPDSC